MEIPERNSWKIAENRTLKAGSSPPRAEMPSCKLLFVKNLGSKTLGLMQNLYPHRPMPRLKSKTTAGDPHARVTGFAVEHNCRLVLIGDTKQHHSVQWGDALRILERSGVIAQATLTKIYRQQIPRLREAIDDLSKGPGRRWARQAGQDWGYLRNSERRRPPGSHRREAY
jgi:AAA domain